MGRRLGICVKCGFFHEETMTCDKEAEDLKGAAGIGRSLDEILKSLAVVMLPDGEERERCGNAMRDDFLSRGIPLNCILKAEQENGRDGKEETDDIEARDLRELR